VHADGNWFLPQVGNASLDEGDGRAARGRDGCGAHQNLQGVLCRIWLLQMPIGQSQKQHLVDSSQGAHRTLYGLQRRHGLLWSVVQQVNDAVIKQCRIMQVMQLGALLWRWDIEWRNASAAVLKSCSAR
jgi:hypothetical protein